MISDIIKFRFGKLFRKGRKKRDSAVTNKITGPKVHVGCGPVEIEGWINVDAREFPHVHIRSNSVLLSEFSDGVLGEIYLCHVLEHFSFSDVEILLSAYYNKLSKNGIIRLSVPDFDLAIGAYHESGNDLELIRMALMGGQDYEFNYHKSVFNENLLTKLLINVGFKSIEKWEPTRDFEGDLGDWSTGVIKRRGGRAYPISLNLKAIR